MIVIVRPGGADCELNGDGQFGNDAVRQPARSDDGALDYSKILDFLLGIDRFVIYAGFALSLPFGSLAVLRQPDLVVGLVRRPTRVIVKRIKFHSYG